MPLTRSKLERQLQAANTDLATHAKKLQAQGMTEADFKSNTKWRALNADIRTVRRRLAAVAGVEANNAAVEKHKTERLAAPVEAPPPPAKAAKETSKKQPPKKK
jgi:hypothetical protein